MLSPSTTVSSDGENDGEAVPAVKSRMGEAGRTGTHREQCSLKTGWEAGVMSSSHVPASGACLLAAESSVPEGSSRWPPENARTPAPPRKAASDGERCLWGATDTIAPFIGRKRAVAYLMLYGSGWMQRWQIPTGQEKAVLSEIARVGQDETGHLSVVDSETGATVILMVAWAAIATAVIVDSDSAPPNHEGTGQYA